MFLADFLFLSSITILHCWQYYSAHQPVAAFVPFVCDVKCLFFVYKMIYKSRRGFPPDCHATEAYMGRPKKLDIKINPFKKKSSQKMIMVRMNNDLYSSYKKLSKKFEIPISTLVRSHLEQIAASEMFRDALGKSA